MNSPAHDDELLDLEYTPLPGVMPLAMVPGGVFGAGGVCEHAFELQALRNTIEALRAEVDNLRAERDAALTRLEDIRDDMLERGEYSD